MNFSRVLCGLLSSTSSQSKKWLLIPPIPIAGVQFSSSAADAATAKRAYKRSPKSNDPPPPLKKKELSELPRPSEIPFQAKVANWVHLVGSVGAPVQLQPLDTGVYSAVSVLVHEQTRESPQFWIPIIFQGDLAEIAACHLKESDLVYVTGQLVGDAPPSDIKDAQTSIKVLAHDLFYVQKESPEKDMISLKDEMASDFCDEMQENSSDFSLWNDLLDNPYNWWDNRSRKSFPRSPAFKHKNSGKVLWINTSTPEWVLSRLDSLSFGQSTAKKSSKWGDVKAENNAENLWKDLVVNPQQWMDNRMDKLNGAVNPKYPDFKHNVSKEGLWLDSAPGWVLPRLDGLLFAGSKSMKKQAKMRNRPQKSEMLKLLKLMGMFVKRQKGSRLQLYLKKGMMHVMTSSTMNENFSTFLLLRRFNQKLWKSLVDNPNKWWDNRADKLKPNYPDFKQKDSGEALWLSSSTPSWVLPKLPPTKTKQKADGHNKATFPKDTLLS